MSAAACVTCKRAPDEGVPFEFEQTCSKPCHDAFIDLVVATFGESKIVIDGKTGTGYRIPTREIAERGVTYADLPRYPVIDL